MNREEQQEIIGALDTILALLAQTSDRLDSLGGEHPTLFTTLFYSRSVQWFEDVRRGLSEVRDEIGDKEIEEEDEEDGYKFHYIHRLIFTEKNRAEKAQYWIATHFIGIEELSLLEDTDERTTYEVRIITPYQICEGDAPWMFGKTNPDTYTLNSEG